MFYEFLDNSQYHHEFKWAVNTVAKSSMIVENCSVCSRYAEYPSAAFDVILEDWVDQPGDGEYGRRMQANSAFFVPFMRSW